MATTSLPTPVLVAGASLCLVAGYVLGVVVGPEGPDEQTATVASYDAATRELCLEGDAAAAADGADEDGVLCGTWRRGSGQADPVEGSAFRFVSVRASDDPDDEGDPVRVLIYGDTADQG